MQKSVAISNVWFTVCQSTWNSLNLPYEHHKAKWSEYPNHKSELKHHFNIDNSEIFVTRKKEEIFSCTVKYYFIITKFEFLKKL